MALVYTLDASGLTVPDQSDLLTFFQDAFLTIYGTDLTQQPSSSPDNQFVNTEIQIILDLQDLLITIYNFFDPDNAIGVVLDQRVTINGIQRQPATFTIQPIHVVVNQGLTLFGLDQDDQPVYTIADQAGNQWQLQQTQTPSVAGNFNTNFQAALPGEVLPVENTITIQVSVVIGVVSVNNPDAYTTLGVNEESDAALKIRRQQSVALSSQGYQPALRAALLNIAGITSAFVFENDSNGTDDDGVPGHSIWVIVSGTATVVLAPAWSNTTTYAWGAVVSSGGQNYISWKNGNVGNAVTDTNSWGIYNPIAMAIYAKRNAGCGMYGQQSYIVIGTDGMPFVVRWDVTSSELLYIKFTATSLNGVNPPNIAAILAQLPVIMILGVDEEVNVNGLATLVQEIDPNTLVTNAGFSTSPTGPFTNTLTPSLKTKFFVVEASAIIIIPMILSPSSTSVAHGGATQQFAPLGGYAPYTYSMLANPSGGSVDPSTGLYTSGGTFPVTDVVEVTDSQSNTAVASVAVT